MICIIIVVLITMLVGGRASAGVVIEQRITTSIHGKPGSVRNRTLMLQDGREKFQLDDRRSIVIDAKNRMVILLDSPDKTFREVPLKLLIGTTLDPNRLLMRMAFKSTRQTREMLGFKCQDYKGERNDGPTLTATTACFSTKTAGSDDFTQFLKLMVQHSRHPQDTSVPAGVPLIIESRRGPNVAFEPLKLPAKEALRFKQRIAKIPTEITRVKVTKITSEKLAPSLFNPPAGYTRRGPAAD